MDTIRSLLTRSLSANIGIIQNILKYNDQTKKCILGKSLTITLPLVFFHSKINKSSVTFILKEKKNPSENYEKLIVEYLEVLN